MAQRADAPRPQNLALALTSTEDVRFADRCDPAALLAKHGASPTPTRSTSCSASSCKATCRTRPATSCSTTCKTAKSVKYPVYWTEDDVANHRTRAVAHLVLTLAGVSVELKLTAEAQRHRESTRLS